MSPLPNKLKLKYVYIYLFLYTNDITWCKARWATGIFLNQPKHFNLFSYSCFKND